jgi:hypothetical protein
MNHLIEETYIQHFFTFDLQRIPSLLTNSCDPQLKKPAAAIRLTARNTLFANKIIGAHCKDKMPNI